MKNNLFNKNILQVKGVFHMNMRKATADDAPEIVNIMDYYMKNTAVHFSYKAPEIDDFRQDMIYITEKFPFFVLEDKSSIKGFAYAKPFSDVPAYDWSCELTIYIKEDFKRKGLGRKLYLAVEDAVKMMGIKNMYSYIAYTEREDEHLDNSSMRFHEKMGFERVARFSKCGYKFDTWYDVIWMEKIIAEHEDHPNRIMSYRDLDEMAAR